MTFQSDDEEEARAPRERPVNDLSPVVIALSLAIVGIEVVLQLADRGFVGGPEAVGWRLDLIDRFAVTGAVWEQVWARGNHAIDLLVRFIAYPFVNGSFTQVAFCAALTLALGKFTSEFYGGLRVAGIWIVTSVAGAAVYGAAASGGYPLFGGFPPVYGLIGAYTYALWLRQKAAGERQIRAFRLIGVLLAIQLLFGLIFGGTPHWVAEVSGFAAGFLVSTLLAPGGWGRLVARMRDRG